MNHTHNTTTHKHHTFTHIPHSYTHMHHTYHTLTHMPCAVCNHIGAYPQDTHAQTVASALPLTSPKHKLPSPQRGLGVSCVTPPQTPNPIVHPPTRLRKPVASMHQNTRLPAAPGTLAPLRAAGPLQLPEGRFRRAGNARKRDIRLRLTRTKLCGEAHWLLPTH